MTMQFFRSRVPAGQAAKWIGRILLLSAIGFFLLRYSIPYWNASYTSGDIIFYVQYAASAGHAIAKGQVPLTYANDGSYALQPSFLYYSPLFPTIAGLFKVVLKINSFQAVLLASSFFCILGGVGVYKVSRQLELDQISAAFACLAFLSSPYLITDMFARAALSELSVFGLLPWWLHSAIKSRHTKFITSVISVATAYALIILAHKIFAVWTLIFGCLYLTLSAGRKFGPVFVQFLGLAVGLIITLPMWINSALMLRYLAIANMDMTATLKFIGAARKDFFDGPPNSVGISWSFINADLSAFFPFPYVSQFSTTPDLHLQLGVAIGVSLAVSLLYRKKQEIVALQTAALVAVVTSASLFHLIPFWRFMPQPLTIIQIPFRLLVFATIFGAVLAAAQLHQLKLERRFWLYATLVLSCFAQPYIFNYRPPVGPQPAEAFGAAKLVSADYQEINGPAPTRALVDASIALREIWPGNCVHGEVEASKDGSVKLPVAYSRRTKVKVDGIDVATLRDHDSRMVVEMAEGRHTVDACRSEPIPIYPYYLALILSVLTIFGVISFRGKRRKKAYKASD